MEPNFFDIPYEYLPQNCDYYFNVLMMELAVPVGALQKQFGITEYEDRQYLTSARPRYLYIYEDEDVVDEEGELEIVPHTVVEINRDTNEFSWYEMLGYETEYPWSFDPIDEDFGHDWDDDEDDHDWYDDEDDWH